jgi:choline monooxygenase
MRDAEEFGLAQVRLPMARVAEWQGLVFAALGGGERQMPEFEDVVGGIGGRCGALDAMRFARRFSYEVACNWKVYVDNFLEGYHLPRVHPGLNRLLDYRSYRTELANWNVLQWSPLDTAQGPYGAAAAPTTGSAAAPAAGEALYWWIWPNTMLNVLPGRLQTNRVVPLGTARCRVAFDYFYSADADSGLAERDHAFAHEVQEEDIAICEAVQRGLASGSYVAGRLNPARESGVWHFHQLLRAAYAS